MPKPTGRPTGRPKGSGVTPVLIRFLEKIRPRSSGCWEWIGALHTTQWGSYGVLWNGEKPERAPRIAYKLFRGPLPDHLLPDHLCRNTICVNPWHLEAVTKKVNTLRGNSPAAYHARQTACINGHPFSVENTYVYSCSTQPILRVCRTCRAARLRAWRRRQVA